MKTITRSQASSSSTAQARRLRREPPARAVGSSVDETLRLARRLARCVPRRLETRCRHDHHRPGQEAGVAGEAGAPGTRSELPSEGPVQARGRPIRGGWGTLRGGVEGGLCGVRPEVGVEGSES